MNCAVCGKEENPVRWDRSVREESIILCATCLHIIRDDYGLVTKFETEHEFRLMVDAQYQQKRVALEAEYALKMARHKIWITYLIGSQKYVKIGKAYNPENRLRQLNKANRNGCRCPEDLGADPLVLLDQREGDHESFLHSKYAVYRVTGEWFKRTRQTEKALKGDLSWK